MKIYVVKPGDNVDSIAQSQGIPVETLVYDNQISPPYRLAVGQALYIGGDSLPEDRTPLYVFGYAYPFIQSDTLDNTLPYLTDLYIFSYGFTETGELVPPMVSDNWMIERAWNTGVRPILTLTPLGEDGRFNNNLVTNLVHNPQVEQRLIWNLGLTMLEKGYGGLDIDFEYIMAEDGAGFAEFVRKTTQIMNQFGYQVSVALAPKTSADQPGLLYEGVNYGLLGEAANRVILMTYEWGYTYEPTGYR